MATAPLYGDQKVAPAAAPAGTLQAPSTNLLGGIAKGVGAIGGELADEAARVRTQFEDVSVMGATSELTAHSVDLSVALKSRQGEAAFEFGNTMMTDFDRKASDIGAKLKSKRARELYAQETLRLKDRLDTQRKEFIGGEGVSHARNVGAGLRYNQTRVVGDVADTLTFDEKGNLNTGLLDHELANLEAASRFEYQAQPGADGGVVAAQVSEDRSKALQGAWELVRTKGSPQMNEQFLRKYGGWMEPSDLSHAREQTRITTEAAAVTDTKAEVIGNVSHSNYRPPPKGYQALPLEQGEYETMIDWDRPPVVNPDGGTSTELSITVRADEIDPDDTSGKWVNIPSVIVGLRPTKKTVISDNGHRTTVTVGEEKYSRIVGQEEAIEAVRTGKERILGVYNTVERAETAAEKRHQWWESSENFDPAKVTPSDRQRGVNIYLDRIHDEKLRNGTKSETDRYFAETRAADAQKEAEDYETSAKLVRDQGWDMARLKQERPDLVENMDSRGYDAIVSAIDQRAKGVRLQPQYETFVNAIKDLGSERTAVGDKAAMKNWMPELVKGEITQDQYDDIVKYQKAYREGDADTLQEIITPRDVASYYSSMLYSGKKNPITKRAPVKEEEDREKLEFLKDLRQAGQAKMVKDKVTKLTSNEWEEIASELANTRVVIDFDAEWRGGNDYISLVDVAGDIPADRRIEAAHALMNEKEPKPLTEVAIRLKDAQLQQARENHRRKLEAEGLPPSEPP